MKRGILNKIKKIFEHKAIVLMYHRIAESESDVWEIAVSPERFEQHLKVLQKMGNTVHLQQLASSINSHHLPKNSIAITFDDGYIDNFKIAKPLLEKYGLPATFFITSSNNEKEFWWDELERIILFAEHLPQVFSLPIGEETIAYELKNETYLTEETRQKHRLWKACTEEPPTIRARLFYKLWQLLKPLSYTEQQQHLQMLRKWANLPLLVRDDYKVMSPGELKQLALNNLFTIGAHTVTHPALGHHNAGFQKREISENKKFLEEIVNHDINLLAYPYGNYNEETLQIVSDSGFHAAFTTEEKTVKEKSPISGLGRFQVKNLTGAEFKDQLKLWRMQ
jgi:peptidoglycan/xylan/chitin deacetylase (PgdA/CDA1 family)